MPDASIASDLDEAFDVQLNLTAKVALHVQVFIDVITKLAHLILGEIANPGIGVHAGGSQNGIGSCTANAIDIGEPNFDSLFPRQVNSCDTCHWLMNTS